MKSTITSLIPVIFSTNYKFPVRHYFIYIYLRQPCITSYFRVHQYAYFGREFYNFFSKKGSFPTVSLLNDSITLFNMGDRAKFSLNNVGVKMVSFLNVTCTIEKNILKHSSIVIFSTLTNKIIIQIKYI